VNVPGREATRAVASDKRSRRLGFDFLALERCCERLILAPVGDAVDPTPAAETTLGSLLELLHAGPAPFGSVQATYRIWVHPGGEELLRVWLAGDRVREERAGGSRDGSYAVREGELWWAWDEASGALSNEDDHSAGREIAEEASIMLDPTPLLGLLKFTLAGVSEVAGRETITVEALPRLRERPLAGSALELHHLGAGAERYLLEVDRQHGVLLKAVAFHDGQPVRQVITEAIAFDPPIPDVQFEFQPPPGEELQPSVGRPHLVHMPVPAAQQRAAFTVLIPERVPLDWRVTCAFIEASERPPSPATVVLQYSSDDGHERVSLSQWAAADQPAQLEQTADEELWETVVQDEIEVRVTRATLDGAQARAYVERDGTAVSLSSSALSPAQLATVAADLKPAPRTSSL
jgi:hypothetical protein